MHIQRVSGKGEVASIQWCREAVQYWGGHCTLSGHNFYGELNYIPME